MIRRFCIKAFPRPTPLRLLTPTPRTFRASAVQRAPPLVAKLVLTATRIGWRFIPKKHRAWLSKVSRPYLVAILGGGSVYGCYFYFSHLETLPITSRRRFLCVTQKEMHHISQRDLKLIEKELSTSFLPESTVDYVRIEKIVQRLAEGCKGMHNLEWKLNVINDDSFQAFVLPTGDMFVHTGCLRVLTNDNALAMLIGHEMSHAILKHTAEQLSFHKILIWLDTAITFSIGALFPELNALLFQEAFWKFLIPSATTLPHSRKCESEADHVGMVLAARACYDPSWGPVVWQHMKQLELAALKEEHGEVSEEVEENVGKVMEFFSTHPSHSRRSEDLEKLLPNAQSELDQNCVKCATSLGFFQRLLGERQQFYYEKRTGTIWE